jgi:hypothetical protein
VTCARESPGVTSERNTGACPADPASYDGDLAVLAKLRFNVGSSVVDRVGAIITFAPDFCAA